MENLKLSNIFNNLNLLNTKTFEEEIDTYNYKNLLTDYLPYLSDSFDSFCYATVENFFDLCDSGLFDYSMLEYNNFLKIKKQIGDDKFKEVLENKLNTTDNRLLWEKFYKKESFFGKLFGKKKSKQVKQQVIEQSFPTISNQIILRSCITDIKETIESNYDGDISDTTMEYWFGKDCEDNFKSAICVDLGIFDSIDKALVNSGLDYTEIDEELIANIYCEIYEPLKHWFKKKYLN